ncbi:hypothetical protein LXL04_020826 [Taraxacum kok-saghyz]
MEKVFKVKETRKACLLTCRFHLTGGFREVLGSFDHAPILSPVGLLSPSWPLIGPVGLSLFSRCYKSTQSSFAQIDHSCVLRFFLHHQRRETSRDLHSFRDFTATSRDLHSFRDFTAVAVFFLRVAIAPTGARFSL